MTVLEWGSGGTQRSTNTSNSSDGWKTNHLNFPSARLAYDGQRPIEVAALSATVGSGDRRYRYRLAGQSTVRAAPGFHDSADFAEFEFRVYRDSGTVYLGLKGESGSGARVTNWIVSGDPVNWDPNGIQPGKLTWYESPSAPGLSIGPGIPPLSIAIDISSPGDDGGRDINGYTIQIAKSSTFNPSQIIRELTRSPGSADVTVTQDNDGNPLPSGIVLYVRTMAKNAVTDGIGNKGGTASAVRTITLTSIPTAPTDLNVVPTSDGLQATVSWTAPLDSGVGITGYEIQRTPTSPSGPAVLYSTTGTGTSTVITDLSPGVTNSWQVRAVTSQGSGPWSEVVSVRQPSSTPSPGDYFDGSTAATVDATFAWEGTAHASPSVARAVSALGWTFSVAASFGAAVESRVAAGLFGAPGVIPSPTAYAYKIAITQNTTGPGFRAGTSFTPTFSGPILPNKPYVGSVWVKPSKPLRVAPMIVWGNEASVSVGEQQGSPVDLLPGVWTRIVTPALTAPATATRAGVYLIVVTGSQLLLAGDEILMDGAMLTLGSALPYFDGSFIPANGFDYVWSGTADQSTSQRLPYVPTTLTDPLRDPDCPPPPAPPRPPLLLDDCIPEITTWRRYWIDIPADATSDWLTSVPTIRITSGGYNAAAVRILLFENPFNRAPSPVWLSDPCTYLVLGFMPASSRFTVDGISERVWAEVRGGAPIPADRLLYGVQGGPPLWPELSCSIPYLAAVDVPESMPVGNLSFEVDLTKRMY